MLALSRIVRAIKAHTTNPIALAAMRSAGDPMVMALAEALERTLQEDLAGLEQTVIARIERRREELLARIDEVEEIDYGAGDPKDLPRAAGSHRVGVVRVADACRLYSRAGPSSLLLYNVVRAVAPASGLELGACMGLSAAYQAAAMKANGRGRLITLEGAPSFAEIASETLETLGLSTIASVEVGPFEETMSGALERLKPVEYIFIDGHHDEVATFDYFKKALPFLADRAVLVFDDIQWSAGMKRAWDAIMRDPAVAVSVTLSTMGICCIGGTTRASYNVILS